MLLLALIPCSARASSDYTIGIMGNGAESEVKSFQCSFLKPCQAYVEVKFINGQTNTLAITSFVTKKNQARFIFQTKTETLSHVFSFSEGTYPPTNRYLQLINAGHASATVTLYQKTSQITKGKMYENPVWRLKQELAVFEIFISKIP